MVCHCHWRGFSESHQGGSWAQAGSCDQNPRFLGMTRWNPTQLYGDYDKPIEESLLNNHDFMESKVGFATSGSDERAQVNAPVESHSKSNGVVLNDVEKMWGMCIKLCCKAMFAYLPALDWLMIFHMFGHITQVDLLWWRKRWCWTPQSVIWKGLATKKSSSSQQKSDSFPRVSGGWLWSKATSREVSSAWLQTKFYPWSPLLWNPSVAEAVLCCLSGRWVRRPRWKTAHRWIEDTENVCQFSKRLRWGAKPWFRRAVNWATMGGDRGGWSVASRGWRFLFSPHFECLLLSSQGSAHAVVPCWLFDIDFVAGASMFKSDQFRDERVCSCYLARSTSAKK